MDKQCINKSKAQITIDFCIIPFEAYYTQQSMHFKQPT